MFSYRWAPFKEPGGSEPAAGNSTLIEFMLSDTGDGTRLRVVESGFSALDTTPERQEELRQGNVEGWGIELDRLAAEWDTRLASIKRMAEDTSDTFSKRV